MLLILIFILFSWPNKLRNERTLHKTWKFLNHISTSCFESLFISFFSRKFTYSFRILCEVIWEGEGSFSAYQRITVKKDLKKSFIGKICIKMKSFFHAGIVSDVTIFVENLFVHLRRKKVWFNQPKWKTILTPCLPVTFVVQTWKLKICRREILKVLHPKNSQLSIDIMSDANSDFSGDGQESDLDGNYIGVSQLFLSFLNDFQMKFSGIRWWQISRW